MFRGPVYKTMQETYMLTCGNELGRSVMRIPMQSPTGLARENIRLDIRKDLTDISDWAMFKPEHGASYTRLRYSMIFFVS